VFFFPLHSSAFSSHSALQHQSRLARVLTPVQRRVGGLNAQTFRQIQTAPAKRTHQTTAAARPTTKVTTHALTAVKLTVRARIAVVGVFDARNRWRDTATTLHIACGAHHTAQRRGGVGAALLCRGQTVRRVATRRHRVGCTNGACRVTFCVVLALLEEVGNASAITTARNEVLILFAAHVVAAGGVRVGSR